MSWFYRTLSAALAWRIDPALAAGTSPQGSLLRSARAAELTSPDARRQMSEILRGLAGNVDAPELPHRYYEDVVYWSAVHAAMGVILSIDARLTAPSPIAAAGMVQLRRILDDRDGPLYFPAPPLALRDALTSALKALDGDFVPQ